MPFCPNCRIEYMMGAILCADCGAMLTDDPPEVTSPTQPTQLAEVESMVELDLIEGQLRAAGIPTARRPRRVALFVPAAVAEAAKRVLQGGSATGPTETLALSELNRIRLVCDECERPTTVDLLAERLPERCSCGHFFDLAEAGPLIERYADLMRAMAEADFEIELEPPAADAEG